MKIKWRVYDSRPRESIICHSLPHVTSRWTLGSDGVGSFDIRLHPPRSKGWQRWHKVYGQLLPGTGEGKWVEAYTQKGDAPQFVGMVTNTMVTSADGGDFVISGRAMNYTPGARE